MLFNNLFLIGLIILQFLLLHQSSTRKTITIRLASNLPKVTASKKCTSIISASGINHSKEKYDGVDATTLLEEHMTRRKGKDNLVKY